MFRPFLETWNWVKNHHPLKIRRLNFITIHYIYIISMAIIGSLIIFASGNIKYIDALFFAAGCATQSGLNTIDINTIETYQQVSFYFLTMLSTPIFVNTMVVFIRLYWFEKRFQHVVREVRNLRRTRSRTKSEPKDNPDLGQIERGVEGRNIVVLHNGKSGKNPVVRSDGEKSNGQERKSSSASSTSREDLAAESRDRPGELPPLAMPSFHREVTFADEVEGGENPHSPPHRLPQRLSPEQHIEFLENQRNPKDKGILRIPGPREFDRGDVPISLNMNDDSGPLTGQVTSPGEPIEVSGGLPLKRNITIEEPDHPRPRSASGTFSKLTLRRTFNSDQIKPIPPADDGGSTSARPKSRPGTSGTLKNWGSKDKEIMPYLSWEPTIGRNSAFVDLTEQQREELGGIEYRSLKTLAIVLVSYYMVFHILGVIILLPWIIRTDTWGSIVESVGQSRVWWGIFTPASLFNDLGFTLTPDSMISFQEAAVPLLLGTFLVIIGNTGFPCMLRFVIWLSSMLVPRDSGIWEELQFLLDHPRRCFTLLFPSIATWWLFWILVALNCLDLILFIVLDLKDPVVTDINPPGYRVLNGLFQAASTRTAGFATVNLALLHPGIQVSYLVMMYISVFPIAISVRRTNVYEEKSLGIYGTSAEEAEDEKEPSYVGAHFRRQLSFDLWYIFLGLFLIALAEGNRIQNTNDYAFTMFSCLFEVVSAYCTVGLSLGYPDKNASFTSVFTPFSKLVIIAMQVRGRHRGLPYELDRAILLPSEHLHKKEDEDASRRLQRRISNPSNPELNSHASRRPSPSAAQSAGSPPPTAESPVVTAMSNELANGDVEKPRAGLANQLTHLKGGLGRLMAHVAAPPKLEVRKSQSRDD